MSELIVTNPRIIYRHEIRHKAVGEHHAITILLQNRLAETIVKDAVIIIIRYNFEKVLLDPIFMILKC